jgi:hypothetical protein
LLAVVALGLGASPAHAHRLDTECKVLPGGKVQVEGWFGISDEVPAGARVVAYEGQRVVAKGRLDDKGRFVFGYAGHGALRVVVDAGAGHRKEVVVPAEKFAKATTTRELAVPPPSERDPSPEPYAPSWHPVDVSPKDVLLGVTFLMALAALVLGVRNSRRLR